MSSFYNELKALVTALDRDQVLKESCPIPVDYAPEPVSRRLRLASDLGEVCRAFRRVGRQLRGAQEPLAKKPS